MPETIYSLRCGECGKQLAKFKDREALIKSGIQIMCRMDKKINFAVLPTSGSSNYTLGKIIEATRRL